MVIDFVINIIIALITQQLVVKATQRGPFVYAWAVGVCTEGISCLGIVHSFAHFVHSGLFFLQDELKIISPSLIR